MAEEDGFRVLLVILPYLDNLVDYAHREIHRRVAREARENGFAVLDLIEHFQKYDIDQIRLAPSDRYVRVQLKDRGAPQILSLAEVKVLGADGITNIALGGTATQSTDAVGTVAGLAIDGNEDGDFFQGSVTHTQSEDEPWWEVDLGSVQQISQVDVFNRTDCCSERLAAFYVFISPQPFVNLPTADQVNQPGVISTFNQISTRYLRIQLKDRGAPQILSLAEVKVLGADGITNIALGGTATQSTDAVGTVAGLAIDGNEDGDFFQGSVTHTQSEDEPWWEVDLGSVQPVSKVILYNRTDCCLERLIDYYLFLSENTFGEDDSTQTTLDRADVHDFFYPLDISHPVPPGAFVDYRGTFLPGDHNGIDWGQPSLRALWDDGAKIYAVAGGWLEQVCHGCSDYHADVDCPSSADGSGNVVYLRHPNGFKTQYAHMKSATVESFLSQYRAGDWVPEGTPLGVLATSGASSGPHLHFGVYSDGPCSGMLSGPRFKENHNHVEPFYADGGQTMWKGTEGIDFPIYKPQLNGLVDFFDVAISSSFINDRTPVDDITIVPLGSTVHVRPYLFGGKGDARIDLLDPGLNLTTIWQSNDRDYDALGQATFETPLPGTYTVRTYRKASEEDWAGIPPRSVHTVTARVLTPIPTSLDPEAPGGTLVNGILDSGLARAGMIWNNNVKTAYSLRLRFDTSLFPDTEVIERAVLRVWRKPPAFDVVVDPLDTHEFGRLCVDIGGTSCAAWLNKCPLGQDECYLETVLPASSRAQIDRAGSTTFDVYLEELFEARSGQNPDFRGYLDFAIPASDPGLPVPELVLFFGQGLPTQLPLAGKRLVVKNKVPDDPEKNKGLWLAKDPAMLVGARGTADDPRCNTDPADTVKATLRFFSSDSGHDTGTIPLPCQNWSPIGRDSDPKGYRYKDRELDEGPCKLVLLKDRKLAKAVCLGAGTMTNFLFDLTEGTDEGVVNVVLTTGTLNYCTAFDGFNGKNGSDGKTFLGKNSPPPLSCP